MNNTTPTPEQERDIDTLLKSFNLAKYDELISRGLSKGEGDRDGQMCIEAVICECFNIHKGYDPKCVTTEVWEFKYRLNDCSRWSSTKARSKGLYELGLAQIGSKGIVDGQEFLNKLQIKLIKKLMPKLFRLVFKDKLELLKLVDRCELEGTKESAADAADAAAYAAADAAAYAAAAAADAADEFLTLTAHLALQTLIELNSPGIKLLSPDVLNYHRQQISA